MKKLRQADRLCSSYCHSVQFFNIPIVLLSFMPHFKLATVRMILSSCGIMPLQYCSLYCNCMKFLQFKTHSHVKRSEANGRTSLPPPESLKHLTVKHRITKSLKQSISLLPIAKLETSIFARTQDPRRNKHKVSVFENQSD
jgi:hypothetical protein